MKLTLKQIFVLEGLAILVLILIWILLPLARGKVDYPVAMISVALVLQLPIVPFEGFSFVIRDADPNSMVKYYWYVTIFAAAFLGGFLRDAL
jgi:hypothetical protein